MKTLQDIVAAFKNGELDETTTKKYVNDVTVFDYVRPCIVIHNPGTLKEFDTGSDTGMTIPDVCFSFTSKNSPWYNNPSIIVIFGYTDEKIISSLQLVQDRFPGLTVYLDDFETFAKTTVFYPTIEPIVKRLYAYNNIRTYNGLAYLNKTNEILDKLYYSTKDEPVVERNTTNFSFLAMDSHKVPTKVTAGNKVIRNTMNDNIIGFSNKEHRMNYKMFSASKAETFSLTELSLILEALVKYKNYNVTDPSKSKLIKAMTDVGAQLTALINELPDAESYSLKGFTGKDIAAMLAAIAWLDIDPKADPEIGELVKRLKKLRGKLNFKKGATITGTVLGTAAVAAGTALAIKAMHDKKVKSEKELLDNIEAIAKDSGIPVFDLAQAMTECPEVTDKDKAILAKFMENMPKPSTSEIAGVMAKTLGGGKNA